ncbi:DUF2147 domain-containing protein [Hymenobacter sp. BT664]|uniref:DUF2147 domain-containing protein n=1 Tax=Hymenobacter montanus TaxID=2771359 RepID=A0A927GKF5_9BACT|nr:DUF2147 domain-containing protein [Hymenobacter montanus]MBD2769512.1 DUF2147 domain-containing protein [Hymenobacter montanus]
MKKPALIWLGWLLLLLLAAPVRAQSSVPPADRILGIWVSESKDARMEIMRSGNYYVGKLLWGNRVVEADGKTFKKDVNNPDPKLRTRSLQNIIHLTGLTYQDGRWTDGKIYDPPSGRTYNCHIEWKDGRIALRGYLGFSMLGRTVLWDRPGK